MAKNRTPKSTPRTAPKVVAIDPGINGCILVTDGVGFLESHAMPIEVAGKEKLVDFDGVHAVLDGIAERFGRVPLFLERAVPMAMGSKGAFTYGRGFEALVIAIKLIGYPYTLVEPQKWAKAMLEGISADLRPKVRSGIAVKRLYPQLVASLPTRPKGGLMDGPIDALLIAGYGLRTRGAGQAVNSDDCGDFY